MNRTAPCGITCCERWPPSGSEPARLAAFAELFVDDSSRPGRRSRTGLRAAVAASFAADGVLFPRLLDALQRPATAALVLDIANHLTRAACSKSIPRAPRVTDLIALLGGLVEGLRRLEENPRK